MRTDPQAKYVGKNSWRLQGCGDTPTPHGCTGCTPGCQVQWYTNGTFIPADQEPTISKDSILRTWSKGGCPYGRRGLQIPTEGNCRQHPWAAPGKAPIYSPCGIDGGN